MNILEKIDKYLSEEKEIPFNKGNMKMMLSKGKGIVVFGTGGGYSDTREFGLTSDQINKMNIDDIIKNAQRAVNGAKDPMMKGRKFKIRLEEK